MDSRVMHLFLQESGAIIGRATKFQNCLDGLDDLGNRGRQKRAFGVASQVPDRLGQSDAKTAKAAWVCQPSLLHTSEHLSKGTTIMEKIPLTQAGYDALNTELKHLKSVERPAIIAAISEARAHGDLSENAEYHSAKEKQSFIEGRVKELEGAISLADVIDTAKLSGTIKFGANVELVDEDTDEEKTYMIVGEYEADIESGRLNIKSPLARALIGKDVGDSVEVKTPGGAKYY